MELALVIIFVVLFLALLVWMTSVMIRRPISVRVRRKKSAFADGGSKEGVNSFIGLFAISIGHSHSCDGHHGHSGCDYAHSHGGFDAGHSGWGGGFDGGGCDGGGDGGGGH